MRAACYCRVSTSAQAEKFGLDAQRRILVGHCQREGHSAEYFIDDGVSGETISARPEFQRLLREAKAGRFHVVLAVDADRYSRASDLSDWQTIKKTFREAGVRWGTPSQWMHDSEFVTDVLSAVSAEEKRRILARTMRGKAEAVRRGKYLTPIPPIGYRVEEKRLKVDAAGARLVKRMFRMTLAGATIRSIARRLNAEGVPTHQGGREWWRSTVSLVLHNALYTGEGLWGKRSKTGAEPIRVTVPRIIDREMFDTVQRMIARRVSLGRDDV
jgi:DNA invertase Pin-like site-specific DNA recombinase